MDPMGYILQNLIDLEGKPLLWHFWEVENKYKHRNPPKKKTTEDDDTSISWQLDFSCFLYVGFLGMTSGFFGKGWSITTCPLTKVLLPVEMESQILHVWNTLPTCTINSNQKCRQKNPYLEHLGYRQILIPNRTGISKSQIYQATNQG